MHKQTLQPCDAFCFRSCFPDEGGLGCEAGHLSGTAALIPAPQLHVRNFLAFENRLNWTGPHLWIPFCRRASAWSAFCLHFCWFINKGHHYLRPLDAYEAPGRAYWVSAGSRQSSEIPAVPRVCRMGSARTHHEGAPCQRACRGVPWPAFCLDHWVPNMSKDSCFSSNI